MTPPQDSDTFVILTGEEIKAKFEELDMLTFLHQTCKPRRIPRSTKTRASRQYTAEHGENFIRKSDGASQAILYWWRLLTGGEEYTVEQFTGPDGTFYTTETVKHPSNIQE